MKRTLLTITFCISLLAGVAYHFLLGYVAVTHIGDSLTVLQRKNFLSPIGANVIVYGDKQETLVIDTQLPSLASFTRSKIESLIDSPITRVIITHWHPDHSGGISAFSDLQVIAHKNVIQRLSAPQEGFGLTKPGSHHEFPAREVKGLPNKSLEQDLEFSIGDKKVTIVHYAHAHTDGDLVIFLPYEQLVVLGDLVWPDSFPYVDVFNGGSVAGLQNALEKILDRSDANYRYVTGHGRSLSNDEVIEYLDMIIETRSWVESRMLLGTSREEIIGRGLPADQLRWSSQLVPGDVWINMIAGEQR